MLIRYYHAICFSLKFQPFRGGEYGIVEFFTPRRYETLNERVEVIRPLLYMGGLCERVTITKLVDKYYYADRSGLFFLKRRRSVTI